MNIISSNVEYKHFSIKLLDFLYDFLKLEILDYLELHKYFEESGYDFVHLEFTNIYNELEAYITFRNYENSIKPLKEFIDNIYSTLVII